ncbi:MAG: hypothetical protein IPM35_24555 [Myxococcales bacterium]|nr:hypothetical protein [Myxococcales bacterium]
MPRRLPVIQSSPDEGEPRPPSHWVAIAAALALALWAPLVLLALPLGRALAARVAGVDDVSQLATAATTSPSLRAAVAAALIVPVLASLALAAGATGAIVGRFGGRAGAREAVLGCTLAALVAWGMSVSGGALRPWPVAVVTALLLGALAAVFAGLGARIGRHRRPQF